MALLRPVMMAIARGVSWISGFLVVGVRGCFG